jgi:membrane associated rhomboid family serine protease
MDRRALLSIFDGVAVLQLIQLYVVSSIAGSLAQSLFDKRTSSYGASAAVNAMVILSVLLDPYATYLLMGVFPAPAWLLGTGFVLYDMHGTYKVCPASRRSSIP